MRWLPVDGGKSLASYVICMSVLAQKERTINNQSCLLLQHLQGTSSSSLGPVTGQKCIGGINQTRILALVWWQQILRKFTQTLAERGIPECCSLWPPVSPVTAHTNLPWSNLLAQLCKVHSAIFQIAKARRQRLLAWSWDWNWIAIDIDWLRAWATTTRPNHVQPSRDLP